MGETLGDVSQMSTGQLVAGAAILLAALVILLVLVAG
jgi:hypothetical protein